MARMYDPGSKRKEALKRKQQAPAPKPPPQAARAERTIAAPAPAPAPTPKPAPPPMEATRPPAGAPQARTPRPAPKAGVPGESPMQAAWQAEQAHTKMSGLGPALSQLGRTLLSFPQGPRERTAYVPQVGGGVKPVKTETDVPIMMFSFGGAGPTQWERVGAAAGREGRLGALTRKQQQQGLRPTPEAPQQKAAETLGRKGIQEVGEEAGERVAKTGAREGLAAGERPTWGQAIKEGITADLRAGKAGIQNLTDELTQATLRLPGATRAAAGATGALLAAQKVGVTPPVIGAGVAGMYPYGEPTPPTTQPPDVIVGQQPPVTTPPATIGEATKRAQDRLAAAGIGGGAPVTPPTGEQPPGTPPPTEEQPPPGVTIGEGEQPPGGGREEPGEVAEWNTIIDDVNRGVGDLVGNLRDALTMNDTELIGVSVAAAQSLLDDIARLRADLVAAYEREGQEIDPATMTVLDNLEKALNDQIRATEEEMNRRGMYWSGILEEAKLRMRTGYLSDRARVLSERLAGIQDTMRQALESLYGRAVEQLGGIYQTGVQSAYAAREAAAQRRADLMEQLLGQRMDLERVRAEERRRRAEEARLTKDAERKYLQWLTEQMGETVPGLPGVQPGLPTWPRQYQQGQLNIQQQRAAAPSRAAPAGVDATATQTVLQYVRGIAQTEGLDAALAALEAEWYDLAREGVDVQCLRDELLREFGTAAPAPAPGGGAALPPAYSPAPVGGPTGWRAQ